MTPPAREVVVQVTAGQPERGWCDRCLTNALLVFPVFVTSAVVAGKEYPCGTLRLCARCDVEEVDE